MKREEVKELLPIMQAFAEGDEIQYRNNYNEWIDVKTGEGLCFTRPSSCYRIKPEIKCRPFRDVEECWQEMRNHQPFGWIKDKNDGHYSIITTVDAATGEDNKHIGISGGNIWTLSETMCDYTFADGEPFGINEDL